MNDFLQDLWNDLREKRMWPVALVLLVALIAVPVVLSKPTKEPAAVAVRAPEAPTAEVSKSLTALTVAEDEPGEGSTLDVFDPSNPFKPPQDIIANSDESTDEGAPSDSGTTDTGATSGGGTDTSGGTGGTTSTPVETKTINYRFVIDGSLTVNGKKKKFESLKTVGLLPNELNPLLAYIGPGKNLDNAVFLVDTTLIPDADGDGKCKPSKAKCAFLYLGPGETQKFTTADGDTYKLRVSQIRKVEVTDDDSDKSSDRRDGATGASTEPTEHRFSSPLLTDLVTGPDDPSDDGQTSP